MFLNAQRYTNSSGGQRENRNLIIRSLNPDINLALVQDIAYKPAQEHPGNGKEQGTEIKSGMNIYFVVEPTVQRLVGRRLNDVQDRDAQFTEQVNEQRVLAKNGKEPGPSGPAPEIDYIEDSRQDDAVQSHRIQNEGTRP
jgi:hypothetical protein